MDESLESDALKRKERLKALREKRDAQKQSGGVSFHACELKAYF